MPPKKAKQKKGGLAEHPPLKRSLDQSSSSECDHSLPEMRSILARIEALEKKAAGRTEAVATQTIPAGPTRANVKTTVIPNIHKSLQDVAAEAKGRECEGPGWGSSFHSTVNGSGSVAEAGMGPSGLACWPSGGSMPSLGQSCPPLGHRAMPAPQVQPGHQGAWLGYGAPPSVPVQLAPSPEAAFPFGFHLLPATKEKIKNGKYVDMFSLLFREPNEERLEVDRNFNNWFAGYLIYVGVILEDRLERAPALLQYLDTIYRASVEYSGSGWLRYDEAFRRKAAQYPLLPWDLVVPGLWLQCVCTDQPVHGEHSDSGHLIPQKSHGVCWDFNKGGRCSRRYCKFKHQCLDCGASHPRSVCSGFQCEQTDESEQND